MKYTLKQPIPFGSETITELNIREKIVAGDLRGIPMRDPMYTEDLLKIIGRLSAQPDPVINAMSIEDLMEVGAAIEGFTGRSRPTGTTPSPS
jgi:hypothetical protein